MVQDYLSPCDNESSQKHSKNNPKLVRFPSCNVESWMGLKLYCHFWQIEGVLAKFERKNVNVDELILHFLFVFL